MSRNIPTRIPFWVIEKEEIALLRRIGASPDSTGIETPLLFELIDVGCARSGSGKYIPTDPSLAGAPRNKHIAPICVGKAIPLAKFGVFTGSFRVSHLGQRSRNHLGGASAATAAVPLDSCRFLAMDASSRFGKFVQSFWRLAVHGRNSRSSYCDRRDSYPYGYTCSQYPCYLFFQLFQVAYSLSLHCMVKHNIYSFFICW